MNTQQRWVVAYAGVSDGARSGRQRIAEVLEAARSWAAPDRTVVVVQENERPWWSVLTTAFPSSHVLAEPFDRGSGTGIIAALLAVQARAPAAEVAVIHEGLSPTTVAAADEALAVDGGVAEDLVAFEGADRSVGRLPLNVASLPVWLRRLEVVDRARVAALRMAFARTAQTTDAMDGLYPFLTALDFEADVIQAGPHPARVVRVARPMMGITGRSVAELASV